MLAILTDTAAELPDSPEVARHAAILRSGPAARSALDESPAAGFERLQSVVFLGFAADPHPLIVSPRPAQSAAKPSHKPSRGPSFTFAVFGLALRDP
jgi:hypothetical protein